MSDLPKIYDPHGIEALWYQRWLHDGLFHAEAGTGKAGYSIVTPPCTSSSGRCGF